MKIERARSAITFAGKLWSSLPTQKTPSRRSGKGVTMSFLNPSAHLEAGVLNAEAHWQARRATEDRTTAGSSSPAACTIAISRAAGTNASAIAARLGERLGWAVYDRELLRHIAEQMGLSARLLESVDEKRTNWLTGYLEAFATEHSVSAGAYLFNLTKVVLSLAAHGECILVGRGLAHFLPPEKTLRVRLVAPLADRIADMQQRNGLGHEDAARRVETIDRDRQNFVNDHFHKDTTDPTLYDVLLNTARFSVDECAELIEQALRRFQAHKPAQAQAAHAG